MTINLNVVEVSETVPFTLGSITIINGDTVTFEGTDQFPQRSETL
jgi:hypothetical protein